MALTAEQKKKAKEKLEMEKKEVGKKGVFKYLKKGKMGRLGKKMRG